MFGGGGGGGGFGLFPNVVSAVELTPNSTMNTAKSIVKLPHCVNRLSGSIFFLLLLMVSLITVKYWSIENQFVCTDLSSFFFFSNSELSSKSLSVWLFSSAAFVAIKRYNFVESYIFSDFLINSFPKRINP